MKIEHKYSFKDKDFEKFMKKNNFEEVHLPSNYTWEKEGKNIINNLDNIILFSNEQKKIIKYLYLNDLIPKQYHSELWYISIGAKREQINNPNYYKNLLNNYPYFIPSAHEKQIELDIPRTFVDPNLQNCSDKILGIKDIFSQSTHPTSQGSIILIEKSKKIKKRKLIDINQPINRRFNTNLLPLTYNSRKRKKSKNH